MALDLFTLADALGDDASLEIGGQKVTGADLKAWAAEQRSGLSAREKALADERAAHEATRSQYKQFENSTSALFRAAAAEAAKGDQGAAPARVVDPNDPFALYENDPVFGPYTKELKGRLVRDIDEGYFKPWVEKQFNPIIQRQQQTIDMITNAYVDERQRREYRELNEWPDDFNLEAARKFGTEKGYFLQGTARQDPNTGQWTGVVDLGRVHRDVMGPTLQKRHDEEVAKAAEEKTLKELRQNFNVIPLPNRSIGGKPPVQAKGRTAEEILGNTISEAANDPETQRALNAIAGYRR